MYLQNFLEQLLAARSYGMVTTVAFQTVKKSSGSNKIRCKLGLRRLSFHSFPNIESAKGKLWIKMIRRNPGTKFIVNKYTKILYALHTSNQMILFCQMNCWRVEDNA